MIIQNLNCSPSCNLVPSAIHIHPYLCWIDIDLMDKMALALPSADQRRKYCDLQFFFVFDESGVGKLCWVFLSVSLCVSFVVMNFLPCHGISCKLSPCWYRIQIRNEEKWVWKVFFPPFFQKLKNLHTASVFLKMFQTLGMISQGKLTEKCQNSWYPLLSEIP